MCYGDISYGSDGYYEEWARNQDQRECDEQQAVRDAEVAAKAQEQEHQSLDNELPF